MKRATSDAACGRAMLFLALLVSAASRAQAPVPEPVTDQETELGKAVYDQLRAKAEIIESSPLYGTLKPVAEAISRVSQSRYPHAESKADVTGSDICAEAGYNPYGLIWLFEDFQNADIKQLPALLSDHPANSTRITTLKKHFQDNPGTFSKFSSDPKSATPLATPKDAPVVFLRPEIGTKTATQ